MLRTKPLSPQRQRHSAQIEIDHQSGLIAAHLQDRAFLIGQDDGLRPADDRGARAGGAVDAFDIRGAIDVADRAAQVGLRSAEGEPIREAAYRQRVSAPLEGERAAADRAADHPARLDE